jgi:hypothetical protein
MHIKSLSFIICSVLLVSLTFEESANATYTRCKNPDLSINKYCFKLGDKGAYIKKASIILSEIGYYQGKPSSIFTKGLETSVIKFQRDVTSQ